jgi:hypothetical protein
MIRQTGKDLEGSTYNPSAETILEFTEREQEKPQKLQLG